MHNQAPIQRRKSKRIYVGNVPIGDGAPIAVQSMTNTRTTDVAATVNQIKALERVGADIVRVSVPTMDAAEAFKLIKQQVNVPLVADIHFDYRLALAAIDAGVSALRLNPGNIGGRDRVEAVVKKAKERRIPIRIGVNAGSLPKDLLEAYGHPTAHAMAEAAWRHIRILEEMDFHDIVISLKAHDVPLTVEAYRKMAAACDYPLHVGITEAGTYHMGIVKSAVGIGTLLAEGIGDTVRVSLTGDPRPEVVTAYEILKSLGLRTYGPTLVSCPTCGRTCVPLEKLALEVEKRLSGLRDPLTIAVMGCAVNGPGEAREADVGIAGGKGEGLLFRKGEILRRVPEDELVDQLFVEIHKIIEERKNS